MLGEKKQRVRRSVEERAAALDAKIQTHKEAIKALEEKKAALFRPKKKRRSGDRKRTDRQSQEIRNVNSGNR